MLLGTCRVSSIRASPFRQITRTVRTRPSQSNPPPPSSQASQASPPSQNGASDSQQSGPPPPPPPPSISSALANTDDTANNLLAPVHIPEDPSAIIKSTHPSTNLLSQSGLVVQRQIEMMNLFLGFEQANRYIIMDPHGNHVGYMAEHDGGFGRVMGRQAFKTHRAFTTHVFDRNEREVLRFHRPFSYINSRIRVLDPLEESQTPNITPSSSTNLATLPSEHPDLEAVRHLSTLPQSAMRVIGEAHSEWAPLRRKYNLFLSHTPPQDLEPGQKPADSFTQFAYIDEPCLSWDFSLRTASKNLIGSVNRNFAGWGRELFTDTGVYALRMDSAGLAEEAEKTHLVSKSNKEGRAYSDILDSEGSDKAGLTLDQRAIMLATAVTVDFDYFSRHSSGSGMFMMPFWMGSGGEAAAGGAAAGGAAEAGGAVVGSGAAEAGGAVIGAGGRAVGGAAVGEGAMAGAGTMAGYEAMQRGMGRGEEGQAGEAGAQGQETQGSSGLDDQSPQNTNEYGDDLGDFSNQTPHGDQQDSGDVWGGSGENDPWSGGGDAGGGGGGGEGGGIFQWIWDLFFGD